ncbi:MAG: TorF family putative porin [Gammaproteobacteria bacterium]
MMKKTLISMACAAAMAAPAAHAELSANIGVTSDYLWRGVTQSGHEAAVSGGVDYAHDSGFYAGIWTSTLGGDNQELDGYLGFAGEYNDLGYDVGYIYYGYLNADDWDFSEIYGSLSWMWLSCGINYTVS